MLSKKRRKFYYPSGLISLILLPVCCLLYLNKQRAFVQYRNLEITWMPDSTNVEHPLWDIWSDIKKPSYFDFIISGNKDAVRMRMISAEKLLAGIKAKNDTLNGVHFHFTDAADYGSVIGVFEICRKYKMLFAPYESEVWALNPPPPPMLPPDIDTAIVNDLIICGTGIITDDEVNIEENKTFFDEFLEIRTLLISLLKKYYILLVFYLLLVIFTFLRPTY